MKKVMNVIVYIESDRHLHMVMNQIVKANGKELRCFDCPERALQDPHTKGSSLIIIDADIPGLNLEKLKTSFRNIPLALISRDGTQELSRPIDRREIEELISKVFSQKKAAA